MGQPDPRVARTHGSGSGDITDSFEVKSACPLFAPKSEYSDFTVKRGQALLPTPFYEGGILSNNPGSS